MELELKHLKGYLGTGLQCHAMGMPTADTEFDDKPIPQVFEIVGLNTVFVEIYEEGRTVTEEMYYSDIFPILRPLSDLTKEIEGSIVYDQLSFRSRLDFQYKCPSILKWSYDDIQILLKYHFDIHGLIEKGLAIDINTI